MKTRTLLLALWFAGTQAAAPQQRGPQPGQPPGQRGRGAQTAPAQQQPAQGLASPNQVCAAGGVIIPCYPGQQVRPATSTRSPASSTGQPLDSIEGRVRRADTLDPLPGALVRLRPLEIPTPFDKPCKAQTETDVADRVSAVADSTGSYALRLPTLGNAEQTNLLDTRIQLALRTERMLRIAARGIPSVSEEDLARENLPTDVVNAIVQSISGQPAIHRQSSDLIAEHEGFVEMPGKFMQDFPDLGLIPGPSISGRITDPTGKPVAGATVQAYRVEYRPLGRTMKFAKSTLTNDLGEYRLFWLPYGFYTVAAGNSKYLSEPWAESLRTSPNAPEPDLGFPLQFYPGVENPGDARLVRVKPTGSWTSETIASFALRERPRFNVKVRPVADPLPANVNLVFVPTGGDVCASRDYFIRANKDGTIDIRDVPVGIYQMVAMRGRDVISPLVPVAVNQDIDDLKLALVPPETIYGTVTFEGMPPQGTFQSFLGDIRVNLTRAGTIVSQVATTLADPRTLNFAIPGLGPGSYYPTIDLPPGAFVKEVRVRKIRRIGAGDGAWTCDAPPDGTYSYLDSHGHLMPLEIPAAVPGNASNDPLCLSMTVSFTGHLGGLAVACGWPGCGPLMAVLFPSSAWRRHDDGGITPPDRIQILSGPAVEFSGVPFDDYRLYAVEYRFADLIFMPDFKDWYTASAASLFYDGREPCGQGTRPAMLNSCVAPSPPGEAIEQLLP